jgi:hypothetical protein
LLTTAIVSVSIGKASSLAAAVSTLCRSSGALSEMAAAASFPFITCEVVVGLLGWLNSKERTGACSSDFGKLNGESLGRREQSTNFFEVKAF